MLIGYHLLHLGWHLRLLEGDNLQLILKINAKNYRLPPPRGMPPPSRIPARPPPGYQPPGARLPPPQPVGQPFAPSKRLGIIIGSTVGVVVLVVIVVVVLFVVTKV
jgi:hypothetical protein